MATVKKSRLYYYETGAQKIFEAFLVARRHCDANHIFSKIAGIT